MQEEPTRAPGIGDDLPGASNVRVVPVGGGKGGVGKSFFVANLAATLAGTGRRVIAVDGDLEGPNLHTCIGVREPRLSFADFVAHREEDVGKLITPTPIPNLELIAGTNGNLAAPQPSHARRIRFLRALRQVPADFVLIDLGAGTHAAVLDYFMVCEDGVVMITPEPTSVENAYGFIRAAFYRRLRLAMVSHDVRAVVALAMDQRNERGIHTPLELLREIQAIDPVEGARFVETMSSFRPKIVINDVRTAADVKLGFSVRSVCRKYFGIDCEYLGYVNHDDTVRESVRMRQPIVIRKPRSDAASYFRRIARKLIETPRVEVQ